MTLKSLGIKLFHKLKYRDQNFKYEHNIRTKTKI